MVDCRTNFIEQWNKLNKRYNELVEIFTLTKEEYNEFRLLCIKINELLKDDSYYFGFEKIKMGNIIK